TRLLKGWRKRRKDAGVRIPSCGLEILVMGLRPPNGGTYTTVDAVLRHIARQRPKQRMVLCGVPSNSPVTLRDASGFNVASEMTAKERDKLIEQARKAVDEIDERALTHSGRSAA
ncbi:MAG: hypothetical protein H6953_19560, partial [Chromatiaceae bacterium]|nr:hypothetical protein [Chromatiaceae bacterium]